MAQDVVFVQSQGQWLALAGGELIATGENFDEVWNACSTPRKQ